MQNAGSQGYASAQDPQRLSETGRAGGRSAWICGQQIATAAVDGGWHCRTYTLAGQGGNKLGIAGVCITQNACTPHEECIWPAPQNAGLRCQIQPLEKHAPRLDAAQSQDATAGRPMQRTAAAAAGTRNHLRGVTVSAPMAKSTMLFTSALKPGCEVIVTVAAHFPNVSCTALTYCTCVGQDKTSGGHGHGSRLDEARDCKSAPIKCKELAQLLTMSWRTSQRQTADITDELSTATSTHR